MEEDPKSLKLFSRYDLAARHWKSANVFDYRSARRVFVPKISPDDFVDTLNSLYATTELRCFRDAAEILLEKHIIVDAAWNVDALTPGVENLEDRAEKNAVDMVKLFVESGMSRRLAIANTVANLRWPGKSFAAAVKSIERICQEVSLQKDRTSSSSKCPKTSER